MSLIFELSFPFLIKGQVLLGLSILKNDLKWIHDYRCFCTELVPETLPVVIGRNGFS